LNEVRLQAPATIANFGPGFDIFALALDRPFNRFQLRLNDSGRITVRISGAEEGIPTEPEKNTAGLAALHFLRRISSPAGAEIHIHKHMQSGSGLGSSAASAAAAVYGLNKLTGAGLSECELLESASQGEAASGGTPHADNAAACLLGGFVLITSYRPLGFQKMRVPHIPLVVGVMRKPQQTTRRLIPQSLALAEVKEQMSCCASLVRALMSGDLRAFGAAINTDYISEPVRSSFIPGYGEFKKRALAAGALGCNVSGGGSSVFAVCEPGSSEAIGEVMRDVFERGGADCRVITTRASNTGVVEIDEL
jgi:homoserine kinase